MSRTRMPGPSLGDSTVLLLHAGDCEPVWESACEGRGLKLLCASEAERARELLTLEEPQLVVLSRPRKGHSWAPFLREAIHSANSAVWLLEEGLLDHPELCGAPAGLRVMGLFGPDCSVLELELLLVTALERLQLEDRVLLLERQLELEAERETELMEVNSQLRRLARHDSVTHLYNHRYFEVRWQHEIAVSSRYGTPVSLLILDLDHFKAFNDELGHPVGDRILRHFADILKSCIRQVDFVARYGGDEFVVVLSNGGRLEACAMADRVLERLKAHPFVDVQGLPRVLSTSIGVATFPDNGSTSQSVIEACDRALYDAKKAGGATHRLPAPRPGVTVVSEPRSEPRSSEEMESFRAHLLALRAEGRGRR